MGMFSYIKCKKELPLNDELKNIDVVWEDAQFQTKDLDNCLDNYVITENGDLIEDIIEYEYTYYTEEEKKLKSHRPWDIVKDQKISKQYTKQVNFHGTIKFYEMFDLSEEEDIWADFEAYFTYGKLDKIELVKTEKHECRKIKMDEFWKEHERKKNSFYYKIRKYSGWFWFWNKVGKICYNVSRFFSNIHTFIIRNNQ
jgi:hypothetical protein